jgi:hypothetical protein
MIFRRAEGSLRCLPMMFPPYPTIKKRHGNNETHASFIDDE